MRDIKVEDTVILLDTSRSMLRSDFKPNRLNLALKVATNFIQTKFSIDPKDRISIIAFGDDIKKVYSFSYNEGDLIEALKKLQISGKGMVLEAISFALQLIVGEMRKIGGKIQRIFIISDNKLSMEPDQLEKILEISKGLGVYIDCCQIGKSLLNESNILKEISKKTNGEYGYFNNEDAVINAGKSFASKKIIKQAVDYFSPRSKEKEPILTNEIALPLRRPTILEIRLMIEKEGSEREKCQICHSNKAPTGADFYSEGRFCPNCDRPMHLSCAAMWATKSESEEHVFRCPFCYLLLKIPKSATKLIKDKLEQSKKIKIIEDNHFRKTKMIEIQQKDITNINASCTYCRNILLEDSKVFQCGNCGSFYHEVCLKKMHNEIGSCRFCGFEITF